MLSRRPVLARRMLEGVRALGGNVTHADHIVVGVDGSDSSEAALRWAIAQARLTSGTITALMTWELPALYDWPMPTAEEVSQTSQNQLAKVIANATGGDDSVPVAPRVAHGHPAKALLRLAADSDASLLVVGSRGLGTFRRVLLGSVAQYCVQHATCPVVVVRR